jgi:hypothetical protein
MEVDVPVEVENIDTDTNVSMNPTRFSKKLPKPHREVDVPVESVNPKKLVGHRNTHRSQCIEVDVSEVPVELESRIELRPSKKLIREPKKSVNHIKYTLKLLHRS